MKRIALILLAVVCASAHAQSWYQNNAYTTTYINGTRVVQVLPGAKVQVCSNISGSCVQQPVYSDQALTQLIAQPIPLDGQGNFGFWVANGTFSYRILNAQGVQVQAYPFSPGSGSGAYLPLTGGTVSGAVNAANGAAGNLSQKYASTDNVQYVQMVSGNDANDGLSPGSGKLTIGAALAALPCNGTMYISASGTVNTSTPITVSAQCPITIKFVSPFALNYTGSASCWWTLTNGTTSTAPITILGASDKAPLWNQVSTTLSTTLKNTVNGTNTMCLNDVSDVTIRGITFYDTATGGAQSTGAHIQFNPNTGGDTGIDIIGNTFVGKTNSMMEPVTGTVLQHLTVQDNNFTNSSSTAFSHDFAIGQFGNSLNFIHNWFYKPGGSALLFGASSNGSDSAVNIYGGNQFDGGSGNNTYAIQGSIQGGVIEGNDFEIWDGAGQSAINVGAQGITVGGNEVFSGCGTGAAGSFQIDATQSSVLANRFSGTPSCTTAVYLSGTSTHVRVDAQHATTPYTTDVSDNGTFDDVTHNALGVGGSNANARVFASSVFLTSLGVTNFTVGNPGYTFNLSSPQVGQVLVIGNANSITNFSGGITGATCSAFTYGLCTTAGLTHAQSVASLVAGTATVSTSAACTVSGTCTYQLTNCGVGGTQGMLSVGTITAGTSFVINSSSNTDTSNVCWSIN